MIFNPRQPGETSGKNDKNSEIRLRGNSTIMLVNAHNYIHRNRFGTIDMLLTHTR